ncbi:MAG: Rne/Rng family ribonuclease [Deltaproteobacteria bacterium]|nr:Rne/Rng family ribonuclease [Deltaproteobacteria bacterium]
MPAVADSAPNGSDLGDPAPAKPQPETLFIQSSAEETRVALQSGAQVVELQVERTTGRGLSGNLYFGRVQRIIASMDAAFVDIGLDRAALLHASDVWAPDAPGRDDDDESVGDAPLRRSFRPIGDLLHQGQGILVQVVREPVAKKGPRVTTYVSLPGRNAVLLAREPQVGVSKMIDDPAERARLQAIARKYLPPGCGAIVRTVGEGATEAELAEDIGFLARQWVDIRTRFEAATGPSFLFDDLDLVLRALRDMVGAQTQTVWISDRGDFDRVATFVRRFHPDARPEVKAHDGPLPLFATFGLDRWVRQAVEPKVHLPSGGELVLQRTEAMTVIDVNSAKQVGGGALDDAVLTLNVEAAHAIAHQLRLRNIGGLVIVDFVDMKRADDRRTLERVFGEALARDRARVRVGKLSEFGTMQLTRKRVRESLADRLTEPCPTCHARGFVRSSSDLAIETLGRLRTALAAAATTQTAVVRVHAPARIAAILGDQLAGSVKALEKNFGVRVELSERSGHGGEIQVQTGGDHGVGSK